MYGSKRNKEEKTYERIKAAEGRFDETDMVGMLKSRRVSWIGYLLESEGSNSTREIKM